MASGRNPSMETMRTRGGGGGGDATDVGAELAEVGDEPPQPPRISSGRSAATTHVDARVVNRPVLLTDGPLSM